MYIYLDIIKEFSCSQCGACCRNNWLVTVDEEGYRRNRELFLSKGCKTEFMEAFIPLGEEADFGEYAKIAKKPSGGCWFLTDNALCGLQQAAGHEHLDTVCQWFPRYPMNTERGIEFSLSFSCPSALRMAMREDPLRIIRGEQSPLAWTPQDFIHHVYPSRQPLNRSLHYYFEIEGHLLDMLQTRQIRLNERLELISQCMEQLDRLCDPETMGRDINRLFLDDYEKLDGAALTKEEKNGPAQWLVENFFVNFIFRKNCYNYGFTHTLRQIERMRNLLGCCLPAPKRQAIDVEEIFQVILELEMEYNHTHKRNEYDRRGAVSDGQSITE